MTRGRLPFQTIEYAETSSKVVVCPPDNYRLSGRVEQPYRSFPQKSKTPQGGGAYPCGVKTIQPSLEVSFG